MLQRGMLLSYISVEKIQLQAHLNSNHERARVGLKLPATIYLIVIHIRFLCSYWTTSTCGFVSLRYTANYFPPDNAAAENDRIVTNPILAATAAVC
jgi:hypothetical protein